VKIKRNLFAATLALPIAACGGDDGAGMPDAGPGTPDAPPINIEQIADVSPIIGGTLISNDAPEYVTHSVTGGKEYLLWMGAYDLDASDPPVPPVLPKTATAGLCMAAYDPVASNVPPGDCDFTEMDGQDMNNEALGDDPATGAIEGPALLDGSPGSLATLTVGTTPLVICGAFHAKPPVDVDDPADGIPDVADRDWYSLAVPADLGNVRVRIRVTGADLATTLPGSSTWVQDDNATPADVTDDLFSANSLGNGTMYSHITYSTSDFPEVMAPATNIRTFRVSASLFTEVMPTGANPTYQIEVVGEARDTACPPTGGAATYVERLDAPGNGHQLNDVVEQRFMNQMGVTNLTVVETDTPEPTGISLDAGNYSFQGTLSTGSDPADEYLDRDSFLVTIPQGVTEVTFRLDWPNSDADLDFFMHRVCRAADVGVDPECPAP
jgi:hypothetical protein